MSTDETPLCWNQTARGELEAYAAACGPYGFEIRTTPAMGYQLRMWQIRPEDSPLLFWEMDGYSLEEAKARAARLAAEHVPAILKEQP
jgi:hypothetical protein